MWCNQIVKVLKPTLFMSLTDEPHVKTSSEQIITFARHEYGRVGVFKIKMRSLA